jgi:single-strand DNA-binding protein
MYDTITITGNVATPPVQRTLPSGVTVTSFRLASNRRRLDRDSGQWIDTGTSWYSVSAYRQLGEHAAASLQKGESVLVTGRPLVREWENDSKRGTSVDIDAESIGHDLRFGTSAFVKRSRPHAGASDGGAGPQAWAVPGSAPESTDAWETTSLPDSLDAIADPESTSADPVPF